ncbi:hypothetical protein C8Q75DRAFT_896131 [Abortiporus biennis]|nr:hypothetical protein C8Q75DRAFT_896131 [Abortiporus biennis]
MRFSVPIVGFVLTVASTATAYEGYQGYRHKGYSHRSHMRGGLEARSPYVDQDLYGREYYDLEACFNPDHGHFSGTHRHFHHELEARDELDLELRDIAEQLVRRAEEHLVRRTGGARGHWNKVLNAIKFTQAAKKDLKYPLASTWGKGEDPKQKHEEIVDKHAHNVPGAHKATILRGAHPAGSDPKEKDHITANYHDQSGSNIKDQAGRKTHHVYTDREKQGIDVKKLWDEHKNKKQ